MRFILDSKKKYFHHLTRAEAGCIQRNTKQSICGGESEDQITFAKNWFGFPTPLRPPFSLKFGECLEETRGVSFTGIQSSRPACDAMFTVRRAITNERGLSTGKPNNFSITGTTNKYPFTSALTGLPGNPITALPLHAPKIVGLPGRVLMP